MCEIRLINSDTESPRGNWRVDVVGYQNKIMTVYGGSNQTGTSDEAEAVAIEWSKCTNWSIVWYEEQEVTVKQLSRGGPYVKDAKGQP